MYKKYNLNELAQTVQTLKEKNTREGLGEEIGLFTLMGEIGFDPRDVKDFAEYCNLRLYDSKKYNEDFEYSSGLEKRQFKKYIQKKIEKLSGIYERLEEREPYERWKKEERKICENIKSKADDIIPSRSNERFGIALGKIINHSSIDVEMLPHLIDCEVFEIQGYLTGKYKDPPKEFIEEIADFFDVDPRHFQEYRKHLGEDYKEDRPITLVNYRITKKKREIFELPEQSDEEFEESFRKLMGASGIGEKELASTLHCSTKSFYSIGKDKKVKMVLIEKIANFFDICPSYFREYREERKRQREKRYYKNNPEKMIEKRRRYYQKHPEGMREGFKRFKENNPEYYREYYKNNRAIVIERAKEYYRTNKITI